MQTYLVLRHMKFVLKWNGSYTRFVGIVRTAIWVRWDVDEMLGFYGAAEGLNGRENGRPINTEVPGRVP